MYPHFEEVRDGGEPWLMARWKVRKDFLFAAVGLFFASAYCCGATRQNVSTLRMWFLEVLRLHPTPEYWQWRLRSRRYQRMIDNIRLSRPYTWNSGGWYSLCRPSEGRRLSRPSSLVTYRNKVPPRESNPDTVTDPSTNRAQRRLTSLTETIGVWQTDGRTDRQTELP